jgi:hypothetical protein
MSFPLWFERVASDPNDSNEQGADRQVTSETVMLYRHQILESAKDTPVNIDL